MNRFVNRFSLLPEADPRATAVAGVRQGTGQCLAAAPERLSRRRVLGGLLLGVTGLPFPARSQSQPVPLVGVLVSTGLHALDYMRQGLRELGFVEGQDVAFAFRSADGNPRDLPGLARHLASLKPAVLFCAGPAAVDAAVHATSTVPIVALDLETDPLRSGLVRSVEHPRTNVTGVFLDQPGFAGRWFELLHQALPQARRINLLWDTSTGPWQLAAAKAAAGRLRFDVDTLVVRDDGEFERELADGMQRKPDALVLLSSPLVRARSKSIAEFCVRQRLPAISPFIEFVQAGGLMSYGPNVQDFYQRAAVFVDKVLKGSLLAGQIGTDASAAGGVVPGGIEAETRQTLNNIKKVLTDIGSSMDRVVKCTVFMADMKEWDAMNVIYRTYFKAPNYPARSAFGASGLALNAKVEIECIAAAK